MNSKDLDFIISQEEFMNDDQLTYMRDLLENMRCAAAPTVTDMPNDDGERFPDPIDQAAKEEQWLIEVKKRAMEADLLSDIDKALHRVDTGEYGYSEVSGEPIDIKRLLANPLSSTTVDEQFEREQLDRQICKALNL